MHFYTDLLRQFEAGTALAGFTVRGPSMTRQIRPWSMMVIIALITTILATLLIVATNLTTIEVNSDYCYHYLLLLK